MAENSPADRPKAKSPRPLLALWPFLRPYKGILAAAMTALLVASGAMLGLPIALKGLIDKGMAAGSADVINGYFIAFMGVAVLFGVFAAIRFYLVTWLGERVVADVRTAVYRNVVRMDPQFFEITRTGATATEVMEASTRLEGDEALGKTARGGASDTVRAVMALLLAAELPGAERE